MDIANASFHFYVLSQLAFLSRIILRANAPETILLHALHSFHTTTQILFSRKGIIFFHSIPGNMQWDEKSNYLVQQGGKAYIPFKLL